MPYHNCRGLVQRCKCHSLLGKNENKHREITDFLIILTYFI